MNICNGTDHSMSKYVARLARRVASTDIKFTISPAVDCLREALFNTRACNTATDKSGSKERKLKKVKSASPGLKLVYPTFGNEL